MKSLKILISLIGLLGIFSVVNVSAMENRITSNFQQNKTNIKPVEFDEEKKCLIFNLDSDSEKYGDEDFKTDLEKKYKDIYINDVDDIQNLYLDIMHKDNPYAFSDDYRKLFDVNNFDYFKLMPSSNCFVLGFKNVNVINNAYLNNLKTNPQNVYFISIIRGFLDFVNDKLKKRLMEPKTLEVKVDLDFSKFNSREDVVVKEEILKKFIKNGKLDEDFNNLKFNNELKDFIKFYEIAHKKLSKTPGCVFFFPENCGYIYDLKNIEHIEYSNDSDVVILKFKNKDFNSREIKHLDSFDDIQFKSLSICAVRQMILFYREAVKNQKFNKDNFENEV